MSDDDKIRKIRIKYFSDKVAYAKCVDVAGPRPEFSDSDTPETRKLKAKLMADWDFTFENMNGFESLRNSP